MLKEHFVRKRFEVSLVEQKDPRLVYRCPACGKSFYKGDVVAKNYICPSCHYYFPLTAARRIRMIADVNSFREIANMATDFDPLNFPGYREKRAAVREKTGMAEALVCGKAAIDGQKIVLAVMDSAFLMGSMGIEVGERITRSVEFAARKKLPLVIFTASGGARMQEGIFSLFQMAKTASALESFSRAGGFYISVLTDPTFGGVSASFAMLGDIILAEKAAHVGFAGPRVIRQTIGQVFPDGFQSADFLKEHGAVDAVVERDQIKSVLSLLIRLHSKGGVSDV